MKEGFVQVASSLPSLESEPAFCTLRFSSAVTVRETENKYSGSKSCCLYDCAMYFFGL